MVDKSNSSSPSESAMKLKHKNLFKYNIKIYLNIT